MSKTKRPYFHRDIQLNNFVITEDGKVYLIDYGNAVSFEKPEAASFSCVKPPEYMFRTKWTIKMEIFQAGKMLTELFHSVSIPSLIKAMLANMLAESPSLRPSLDHVSEILQTQLLQSEILQTKFTPVNTLEEDISSLEKNLTIDNISIDLDNPVTVRSWSRSCFFPVKRSLRQYLAEMCSKDTAKAINIVTAIKQRNLLLLEEALQKHRNCFSYGFTTGSLIYNNSVAEVKFPTRREEAHSKKVG